MEQEPLCKVHPRSDAYFWRIPGLLVTPLLQGGCLPSACGLGTLSHGTARRLGASRATQVHCDWKLAELQAGTVH
jgi:hypothetical protein